MIIYSKIQRRIVVSLLLFLFISLLTACFHENEENSPKVNELVVYPENLLVTQLGTEVPLSIQSLDKNSQVITKNLENVIWQSSDESIATVDDKGMVSALSKGSVIISASYENFSNSSSIIIDESNLNINGLARYEDMLYDTCEDNNDTSNCDSLVLSKFKNIRHAIIDLLDADGNILDTTVTSESGRFAFAPIIPDKYDIRIVAKVDESYISGFEIADLNGRIHAVTFSSIEGDDPYQLDLMQDTPFAGAFNLLDVITASAEFAKQRLGVNVNNLSVYWQKGSNNGTYYCTGSDIFQCEQGEGIYVLSERSGKPKNDDTDEFDDDVIMHEFGHYLLERFAVDDSLGGEHHFVQNDSDMRLAWSEGWGAFLPTAIKSWLLLNKQFLLSTNEISGYVDTIHSTPYSNVTSISFDISNPALIYENGDVEPDDSFYYASSEAAVAKILWDIHEQVNFGMDKIWDSVSNKMKPLSTPTNLPSFWDALLSSDLTSTSEISQFEAIFNDRQVFYEDDASESDDSIATATLYTVGVDQPMTNYLYLDSAGMLDEDYYQFAVNAGDTYEIRTGELRNGIDTSIRILDENGNVVMQNGVALENDDDVAGVDYRRYDEACFCFRVINDGESLASKLEFTPSENGSYYVKVWYSDKFSSELNSTGHYGTYTLSINLKLDPP